MTSLRFTLSLTISLVLSLAFASVPRAAANGFEETVRLAADPWMPYNSEVGAERSGYVIDLAREIFEPRGIRVDYQNIPWEETLEATREGDVDGAVCANVNEGAGLILPKEPVGAPKMIMLTRKDATWNYQNIRSLGEVRLGVIAEYSYWEALDRYIVRSTQSSVYVSRSETPLDELFSMLDAGEIDVLIESEAVAIWKLREMGKTGDDYRTVYRGLPDPVFIAFASNERGRRFAEIFDAGMKELVASGRADEIAASYGLRVWR